MITKSEIEQKSKEFEINTADVERDYVFGWILYGLFTISTLKDEIFLKGGNALRKGYFADTRYSSDLDLGIPGDMNELVLLSQINKVCDFIQEKAGISFVKENNKIKEKFIATDAPIPGLKVYEVRIYFKDFYGKADHFTLKISLDITRFDKVILPLQKVKLIHPYSDSQDVACEITCMKLEEIIATKLKCIMQRQHAPDLFDYVHSIKLLGGNLNKQEVVDTFIRKTIFGRNPHILKNILQKTPFDYFKVYWHKTIVCAKKILFNVEEAISFFVADLENLFSSFPDNGYRQFAFFGPEFRIPIMEAGRNQTLLKIRYKGEDRTVEPYSLKYLQKKDGTQKEYFYAYKRDGGESKPGMRCFLAESMEKIEATTEKFEPQYPIELSKAGERPENPYLFDPNNPARVSRRRQFRLKYMYQCVYCGKKFTKTSMNSTLGEHKNKNGYSCTSRRGSYVGSKY